MNNNPILIALLGDIALHGLFCEEPGKNKYRFTDIIPLLQAPHITIANLETPIQGNDEQNERKKDKKGIVHYTQKPIVEEILPILNINTVTLANNHIYDCKSSGILNTTQCLDRLNIKYTGAGTKKENTQPLILKINDQTIGLAAYVHPSTNPMVDENNTFVNVFDIEKVIDDIKQLIEKCTCTIISIHWGVDYSFYPTKEQRKISMQLIDAGADIIMGHHPHTVQPYEIYKEKYIFYSLGSFCFGDIIHEGQRRSLKRKTKKTILPIMELIPSPIPTLKMKHCYSLKEKKGNTVTRKTISLIPFLTYRLFLMKLKHKYKVVDALLRLKESIFDRVVEYFFGYYRNPVKQLFAFSNLRKAKYLSRDYRKNN